MKFKFDTDWRCCSVFLAKWLNTNAINESTKNEPNTMISMIVSKIITTCCFSQITTFRFFGMSPSLFVFSNLITTVDFYGHALVNICMHRLLHLLPSGALHCCSATAGPFTLLCMYVAGASPKSLCATLSRQKNTVSNNKSETVGYKCKISCDFKLAKSCINREIEH